ncbi:MAG: hypothetical protein KJ057_10025 [Phycisphaerae bacterium]|nr:hypothetical protein [Planctomycetia bacterium]MCK6465209.1 hypothetical protein [Phycisphaerae bacterium]MCL4718795.1 hypothetical protein [Phycisphaerae bacterium]NUQ10423.1 hypothetical protein [Phycisphaerae bacterium]
MSRELRRSKNEIQARIDGIAAAVGRSRIYISASRPGDASRSAGRGGGGARRGGITLLEVILSIGITVTLMAMLFGFYNSTLKDRTESLKASSRIQLARAVVAQMEEEIRQASSFTPYYGTGIVGGRDWIQVFTTRLPRKVLSEDRSRFERPIPGEFDLCEVRYYIARHEEVQDDEGFPLALGLVRKETRTLGKGKTVGSVHGRNRSGDVDGDGIEDDEVFDDEPMDEEDSGLLDDSEVSEDDMPVKEELYAPEIKFIRFHYFDGNTWWEDWRLEGANSLPQVVRITIGFTPKPPFDEFEEEVDLFLEAPEDQTALEEDQYTMFVRVLQSDTFFGSRLTRTAQSVMDAQEEAEGF